MSFRLRAEGLAIPVKGLGPEESGTGRDGRHALWHSVFLASGVQSCAVPPLSYVVTAQHRRPLSLSASYPRPPPLAFTTLRTVQA